MGNKTIAVDLVYLWVDGNDPKWQAKRNAFIGKTNESTPNDCKGRYANNDELKYSLRSIEMYAPWIRKIFIVTDEQTPEWLNTDNPKIKIVDHKDIMPTECLPCYNSCIIEHYIYRIEGLSEHFLLANDDMFLNKETTYSDFFNANDFPIIRLNRKPFRKIRWYWRENIRKNPLKNYSKTIANVSKLIEEKYGIYYSGLPHHNIDAYCKSNNKQIVEVIFPQKFLENRGHHVRNNDDIQRVIFSYIPLAEKRGELKYVTGEESMLVRIHKKKDYDKLTKNNPIFFCMNDSEYAQDSDRIEAKVFLERRFPEKSSFEK